MNFDILSTLSKHSPLIFTTVPDTNMQSCVISYLNVFYNYVDYVDTLWWDAYNLLFVTCEILQYVR